MSSVFWAVIPEVRFIANQCSKNC